jgi:hypothetical protein
LPVNSARSIVMRANASCTNLSGGPLVTRGTGRSLSLADKFLDPARKPRAFLEFRIIISIIWNLLGPPTQAEFLTPGLGKGGRFGDSASLLSLCDPTALFACPIEWQRVTVGPPYRGILAFAAMVAVIASKLPNLGLIAIPGIGGGPELRSDQRSPNCRTEITTVHRDPGNIDGRSRIRASPRQRHHSHQFQPSLRLRRPGNGSRSPLACLDRGGGDCCLVVCAAANSFRHLCVFSRWKRRRRASCGHSRKESASPCVQYFWLVRGAGRRDVGWPSLCRQRHPTWSIVRA